MQINKTILIFDRGDYTTLLSSLIKHFSKVLYYCDNKSSYPMSANSVVGTGIEGVERVENFFDAVDDADIIAFFGNHDEDLQEYLKRQGKQVWGSGRGNELENNRFESNEILGVVGLPKVEMESIIGIDALRDYLRANDDIYVKNNFRGVFETFHSENYDLIEPMLDKIERDLGKDKDLFEFICCKPLDGKDIVEVGADTYIVNGEYPNTLMWGYEVKDCYDKETEVLTDDGWKLFRDLNKSENVLTLNLSDKRHIKYEFQRPTDYIERGYSGKMVCIDKESVSLCITPTHNVLVRDGIQNENAKEVEWYKLKTGGGREEIATKFKRGKADLRLQRICDVIDRNKRFSLFQPKGSYRTNNPSTDKIHIGNYKISKIKFAEFLGYYLSEGHTRLGKAKTNGQITISQKKYPDRIEELLKKMPFKYRKSVKGDGVCNFYILDIDVVRYCHQFGLSGDKFVPKWIKESTVSVINKFLDAYCVGDGTFSKKYKKIRKDSSAAHKYSSGYKELISRYFYTSSRKMADDLQELLIKIGSVSISRADKMYYNHSKGRAVIIYGVQEKLINRKNYIFPEDVSYIDYNDLVYCVSVPNGIIMTRRNGKAMWCGNCGYIGIVKQRDMVSKILTEPLDKLSPVFKEYDYRGFFSDEIRVGKDRKPYLTDFTCRCPSPCSELYFNMLDNLGEIIDKGSQGILVEPKYCAKYGVQAIITSSFAEQNWQPIHIDDSVKDYVKIKHLAVIDNLSYYIPIDGVEMSEIGSLIAYDNTLNGAISKLKEYAKKVDGFKIHINVDSIDEGLKVIEKGRLLGLMFN